METPTAAATITKKSGIKLAIGTFVGCIVALFAAAAIMSSQVEGENATYLWAMVLLGAVVIAALLAAVFVPHWKEFREHR
jgi:uncharacterized membrane protein YdjX (TVP38/TMEM64 family)